MVWLLVCRARSCPRVDLDPVRSFRIQYVDSELVVKREREPQDVEAGAKIGAGGRRAHNYGVWQVGLTGCEASGPGQLLIVSLHKYPHRDLSVAAPARSHQETRSRKQILS